MSENSPPFDLAQAHKYFAANCFNETWSQIERADRTPEEDDAMVLSAAASLWHWTQRPDCTDQNLSIGNWLLSRTYALTGQGHSAMRHALRCLLLAAGCPKFYIGYAHEAVARAAAMLSEEATCEAHLLEAHACLAEIEDDSEREMLERDLQELAHDLGLDV